jgi:hypothetical protein
VLGAVDVSGNTPELSSQNYSLPGQVAQVAIAVLRTAAIASLGASGTECATCQVFLFGPLVQSVLSPDYGWTIGKSGFDSRLGSRIQTGCRSNPAPCPVSIEGKAPGTLL